MPDANRIESATPAQTGLVPFYEAHGRPLPATVIARPGSWSAPLAIERGALDRERLAHPSTLRRWFVRIALAGATSSLLLICPSMITGPKPEPTPRASVERPVAERPTRVVRLAPIVLAPIELADDASADPEPAPLVPLDTAGKSEASPQRVRRSARAAVRTKTAIPAPAASKSIAGGRAFNRQMRAGELAFKRGSFEKALKHYTRAAQLDPSSADANFGVALAAVELHRDELGYRAVFRTLRLAPDHALGNLLAGYLMQTYEDPEGASAAYARYLDVEPEGRFAVEVRTLLRSMSAPRYATR